MRKLILWNIITLDGYFEGVKSWDLFWHELVWGPELQQFSVEQLRSADGLVFGRATYEGMAAYWPTAEGEVAGYMNRLPKAVCSRTLQSADWNNTTITRDAATAVSRLKHLGDGNLFVFGSANLAETLMSEHLFDEYRIGIAPVVVGAGRRLFGDGLKQQQFQLLETRPLTTGCVIVRYQAASAV
jgi:dihydrofolate reductase